MHRIGRMMAIVGGFTTLISIVVGFTAMLNDYEALAKIFITLVPFGFLLLFMGVVTTFLSEPEKQDKE
mgnify:CR=1 FL=1